MDLILKRLWAQVLDAMEDHLEDDDNFFEIGGSSINAVRLAEAAEEIGYVLTVSDIYRHPELSQMSSILKPSHGTPSQDADPAPFELLAKGHDPHGTVSRLSKILRASKASIEDAYPCTALQEGLMALSLRSPGSYILQFTFRLPSDLKTARLQEAWEKVVASSDVLRARIARLDDPVGLFQVILKLPVVWQGATGLEAYLATDARRPMSLGDPLIRLAIVTETPEDRYLVWTIHHAICDRWSIALTLDQVGAAYQGAEQTQIKPPRFAAFMKYLNNADQTEFQRYWETKLAGCHARQFPKLPTPTHQPRTSELLQHSASIPWRDSSTILRSTVIQAAWALTLSRHSDSHDVVFGMTLAGRDIPVKGVTRMHGPTVATVPVAIRCNSEETKERFLSQVQAQMHEMIPFQHFGIQRISGLNSDTKYACQFQSLLVVQSTPDESSVLGWQKVETQKPDLFNYGITVECEPGQGPQTLSIRVHFDPRMITAREVETLVHHFGQAIVQLNEGAQDKPLAHISLLGSYDHSKISEWNRKEPPPPVEMCIHQAFRDVVHRRSQYTAIESWDGIMTYDKLDQLSSRLSRHLTSEHDVGPEHLVALCFEKSFWMPVAMLGVLKAGGAFVPLEPSHPRARLHQIVQSSRAKVVLTSAQNGELFTGSAAAILCVDQTRFDHLHPDQLSDLPSTIGPQNAAYVIFTSGSTGRPKGVLIEHRAFLTSAFAHGAVMNMSESSRVLQFASYAFDMSLIEILTTLLFGGCVCIPGEHERLHTLPETMNRMRINFAILTPAASRILIPATLPHLRTLVLGGEELSEADSERWTRHGLHIMNAYGPTECSVVCSVNAFVAQETPESIGNAVGCRIWIIEEHNANRLAPLGCVGELAVEGPILARGYMDNPSLTAACFPEKLDLPHMAGDHPGMTSRRFYKTGDIVRYGPDGSVHFIRRKDEQLKLRGHRLETSEIEHHIKSYLGDRVYVAVMKHRVPDLAGNETSSGDFLAALICDLDGEKPTSTTSIEIKDTPHPRFLSLRNQLETFLPSYMIPSTYIPIESTPLTSSGKLDRASLRRALSSMTREQLSQLSLSTGQKKQPPSTSMEHRLHKWWAQVLRLPLDAIGVDDSFFQLGGDSILAMHLCSIARTANVKLNVFDVFSNSSLAQLARRAEEESHDQKCSPEYGQYGIEIA